MTNWKDAGSGIILWGPTARVEVDVTDRTSLRLSVGTDNMEDYGHDDVAASILPSVEENLRTKQMIFHELFGTPEEAPTILPDGRSSTPSTKRSSSLAEESSKSAAQSLLSPGASERFTTHSLGSSSLLALDADIDSDYIDFLPTPDSPCPARLFGRGLDFGVISRDVNLTKMGLVALEYSPPHVWTYEEREFLCCLWRWYLRNTVQFAHIYNYVWKQDLSMSKIRGQLESHLRFFGPDAFPVYKTIFSIPFHDPRDQYKATRDIIEGAAAKLNIKLHRLRKEAISPPGRAKYARSPKIRKVYRGLVKRAKEAEKRRSTRATSTGGFAVSVDARFEDTEFVVEKDDQTLLLPPSHPPATSPSTPAIAFRVWQESSGSSFSPEQGFRAGAAGPWNGAIPPFRLEDPEGKKMIMLTCNSHFSNEKIPSYWISVFTSLLEALVKAAQMVHPRIAILNLHHHSLQEPNKMLSAAKTLQTLRRMGQTRWARTKHLAEILVWYEIPPAAIISHFSLSNLIELNDKYDVIREMLQLYEFQAGRRTSMVASLLVRKKVTIDLFSARAMALVCKEFGLSDLRHISDLIARLIDGWGITIDVSCDLNDVSSAFALALIAHVPTHSSYNLAHAFVVGCNEGTKVLRYWEERRQSSSRRSK